MGARVYQDTVEWQSDDPEPWMDRASCINEDPTLFFPERGNAEQRTADAKKVCLNKCSVRLECLARTMAQEKGTSRRYGVSGGMTPTERERLQGLLDEREKKS